jgi:hypothetical protein
MNIAGELKKRFTGWLNSIVLMAIFCICFRFAGAEWKSLDLGTRALRGLYILLGVVGVGLLGAVLRLWIARLDSPSYWRTRADEVAVAGLKVGVLVGGAIVFLMGLLLVDEYLGPFGKLLEKLFDKTPG